VEIPLNELVSDENVDDEYAQRLASRDVAKFTPIIVMKHPSKRLYAVLDGHHRFRAAQLRGLEKIRAVVVDDYTGMGFDLTRKGFFQPSTEVTRYIRVPLKRFHERMCDFLFSNARALSSFRLETWLFLRECGWVLHVLYRARGNLAYEYLMKY
jgi:hypothetical protein